MTTDYTETIIFLRVYVRRVFVFRFVQVETLTDSNDSRKTGCKIKKKNWKRKKNETVAESVIVVGRPCTEGGGRTDLLKRPNFHSDGYKEANTPQPPCPVLNSFKPLGGIIKTGKDTTLLRASTHP